VLRLFAPHVEDPLGGTFGDPNATPLAHTRDPRAS